ncbi:MAG: asparagine synthase (glutamine-hydrolyzing) [Bacteroidetes bacterium]|nr:asparagine synthase (glutamine-hydrolyzing) [Bacteroidota bacterium]
MCGINGIIGLNGKSDHREQVQRMNNALAHRGPDDEGIFSENGITLGHRRLSIIDLSSAGHQPMQYEHAGKKYTLIFNGELYNFREIKKELQQEGFVFRTNSDSEVVLAAYAKWKSDCLMQFNGMFAFAVYEHAAGEVFIVRDRMGIKPLYFFQNENEFIFSSEIRGIIASGLMKPEISETQTRDYFLYQTVHAPSTIIAGISMLPPGSYMQIRNNQNGTKKEKEIHQWWSPKIEAGKEKFNYENVKKKVRQLLRDAVECRLVSDVPFGAFLSGGIDSSAIVALMTEVAVSKVKTFSVVFDDSEFSEAVYARRIAEKFKTEHHEIKLSPEDFLHELPAALDAMDHPGGDGPNTYVVSKATKQAGITMALSGLGGDELFCGYSIFKQAAELERKKWLNVVPRAMRSAGGNIASKLKRGVAGDKRKAILSSSAVDFNSAYPFYRMVLMEDQIRTIYDGRTRGGSAFDSAIKNINSGNSSHHLLSRVSMLEIGTYMQNVLLRDTDQMAMAHALEVRVPFLDYKLVEYVLSLPDEIKYPSTPKKLLVDSLGDLLPREIVDRPKMGFTFPWKNWMKNELKSFCEVRLHSLGERKYFNAKGLDELWKKFLQDDPRVTWSRVWPLVALAHWLNKNGIDD